MSIVRTYRFSPETTRATDYREAWYDEAAAEFVIHHGAVGQPGTTAVEKVEDAATGEELLAGFAAQCQEDGFRELADEDHHLLSVTYQLKGNSPTPVETTLLNKLESEITHRLAWRGLGDVVETRHDGGVAVLIVAALHVRKAEAEIPAAVKSAGVQLSKVSVTRR
ncbi:MAG: hypothetical protein ACTHZ5_05070 [Micrococcaceae bacterium]